MNPQTREFILEHINDDPSKLALSAKRDSGVDVLWAIQQIKARKAIQHKIPSWYKNPDIIFPVQLSVEQSSSEQTAIFKSGLIQGNTLVDLTGGFGVDCAFMAQHFNEVVYVERNEELCEIARQNFKILRLSHILVKNMDSVEYLQSMEPVDCIFIDPARRDTKGKKTVAFADCEPDITQLLTLLLLKANTVLVKSSPMHDISLALNELKYTSNIFVVAIENECKELLFLLKNKAIEISIASVNLHKNKHEDSFLFSLQEEQETICEYTSQPEKYLYEPNAAILKVGAYKSVAKRFGLKKLHPNSHLYTSDVLRDDFPGRIFLVDSYFSLNKQSIKQQLQEIRQANITIRNFPETVDALRKKLKIADGGNVYLFATTLFDEKKVLIKCRKILNNN